MLRVRCRRGSGIAVDERGAVVRCEQPLVWVDTKAVCTLDAAETARWQRAASGVRAVWYKEVASKGLDGPKLAAEAEALIAKHSKK